MGRKEVSKAKPKNGSQNINFRTSNRLRRQKISPRISRPGVTKKVIEKSSSVARFNDNTVFENRTPRASEDNRSHDTEAGDHLDVDVERTVSQLDRTASAPVHGDGDRDSMKETERSEENVNGTRNFSIGASEQSRGAGNEYTDDRGEQQEDQDNVPKRILSL